jgi:hypothetical protein
MQMKPLAVVRQVAPLTQGMLPQESVGVQLDGKPTKQSFGKKKRVTKGDNEEENN